MNTPDEKTRAAMNRYDPDAPLTEDYEDDCASCGQPFPRSELAWHRDELECAPCENARITRSAVDALGAPAAPSADHYMRELPSHALRRMLADPSRFGVGERLDADAILRERETDYGRFSPNT